jgi:hypothetical protein
MLRVAIKALSIVRVLVVVGVVYFVAAIILNPPPGMIRYTTIPWPAMRVVLIGGGISLALNLIDAVLRRRLRPSDPPTIRIG